MKELLKYKIVNFIDSLSDSKILNQILSKITIFHSKYSNYFLNNYEFIKKKDYLYSYPTIVGLNSTNLCNYRCKFCEIHYFYDFANKTAGKVFPNHINVHFIEKFDKLFDKIISIELSAASGEAMVNPHFIDICSKFKDKKIQISVTTNGSLLDKNIAEKLVNIKFNHVMVSLHSGDEKNYLELQGGNYNKILKNIEYLIKFRNQNRSSLPKLSINCLIFKLNMHTIKDLMKKMKEMNIDEMNINQYYASRNKINHEASFYFNPKEGNEFLKDIYDYANSINLKLKPEYPNYIETHKREIYLSNNNTCKLPWNYLTFKGCVEHEDSHYIGVCNRLLIFRLNYEEFNGDFMEDIWNHELIRFFRKTVMKNPICKFCRNPNTPYLRCFDNKKYQINRDRVFKEFFKEAFNSINIEKRKGIYLLNENPYKYVDYY